MPRLLGASSYSGTWYCQVHHSAGDVVHISSLDMPKPTMVPTVYKLVDECKIEYASNFFVSHVIPSGHSEDPAKHSHLPGSNLLLVGHLHRPAFQDFTYSP